MKKYINIIKPVIFCIICVLIFGLISPLFKVQDSRVPVIMNGYYEEENNSLDAVFIGASNFYAGWQPPLAYHEFGYTSYTLAFPHLPNASLLYYLDEAHKTQPDALFVISLNGFTVDSISKEHLHHSLDYFPLTENKKGMIDEFTEEYELTPEEVFELYVPFVRFHSAWPDLESRSFSNPLNNFRGGQTFGKLLDVNVDEHYNYVYTEESTFPEGRDKETLDKLISYINKNDVKVVFVTMPQALTVRKPHRVARINGVMDYLRDAGFDVIDMMPESSYEASGLDLTYDFYNFKHVNIHGALKVMRYINSFIQDKYDLHGDLSEAEKKDWETAFKDYNRFLIGRLLDFEWDDSPRDLSLEGVDITTLTPQDYGFSLTWQTAYEGNGSEAGEGISNVADNSDVIPDHAPPVPDGVDGYVIYRKNKMPNGSTTDYERIAEVTGTSYEDHIEDLSYKTMYTYAVVPYHKEGSTYTYGKYNINGKARESVKKPKKNK